MVILIPNEVFPIVKPAVFTSTLDNVFRYDIRNRLDDKTQFGLKSSIPHKLSAEEEAFEELLDSERYLALEADEESRAGLWHGEVTE